MNLLELARSVLPSNRHLPSASGAPARQWLIRRAAGKPLEVIFSDTIALADVQDAYPDAVELVRHDDIRVRTATPAEAAELRSLIPKVLADARYEWNEALRAAVADPKAALESFRVLSPR